MSESPTPRFPEAEPYFVGDERTNRERMLAGDWYVADDPDNARIAAHARTMLHRFERAFAEGEEDCWACCAQRSRGWATRHTCCRRCAWTTGTTSP